MECHVPQSTSADDASRTARVQEVIQEQILPLLLPLSIPDRSPSPNVTNPFDWVDELLAALCLACSKASCGFCIDHQVARPGTRIIDVPTSELNPAEETQDLAIFLGSWRNISTKGLDAYLREMGVSWTERRVAAGFRPKISISLSEDTLRIRMPLPFGERVEKLPIGEVFVDSDPSGKQFIKRSYWEGSTLVTNAEDPSGKLKDVVTRRWIRASDGALMQTSTICVSGGHGDARSVSFERIFVRT